MSSKFISRGADKYDSFMGRWSRRLAPLFIDFAGLGVGDRVLDVGCGTGSLTFELVKHANVASVEAIDYDPNRAANAGSRRTGRYENGRSQSTFMFANLTTLAHLSVSAAICFAASAGDPPSTVSPRSAIRALIR